MSSGVISDVCKSEHELCTRGGLRLRNILYLVVKAKPGLKIEIKQALIGEALRQYKHATNIVIFIYCITSQMIGMALSDSAYIMTVCSYGELI